MLILLLLSLPSGQAFASGPGSALPIGAAGTQAVNGVAQSGAPPAPPAVQPTVAPVAGAVRQIVNKATEPVTGGAPTDVKKVTAPVSGAVVQSAGKTVAPVLNTTTQTARKAAAPVLQTVSKTVAGTVAPVVKAATQSAGKTLDNATAPVLRTATRTVNNATAPVLQGATQTVGNIAAPVLQKTVHTVGNATAPVLRTATHIVGATTAPTGKVAASTVAGGVQGVNGAPTLPSKVVSASNLTSSSSSPPAAITREPPLLPGTATHLDEIHGASSSSPFGARIHWSIDAPMAATPSLGRRGTASSASNIRTPPAAPGPLPAGGSSGAMASAAGVAFSIFLTLAGLLLMGGLAAMRLLRLASEPWRAAPFVLIPERPG